MKVSDLHKCNDIWAEAKVVINNRGGEEVFDGTFYEMPKELAEREIDFWTVSDIRNFVKTPVRRATEIFVALK